MAEGVLVFASICKWKFFFALWTISSYFWLKRMPWRNSVSQYRTCRITLRQPLESCFNGSLLPWLRICLFRIFFCIIASAFSVCLNCTFISRTRCGKLTRTATHVCPLRQSAYLKDATSVLLWKMRVCFFTADRVGLLDFCEIIFQKKFFNHPVTSHI